MDGLQRRKKEEDNKLLKLKQPISQFKLRQISTIYIYRNINDKEVKLYAKHNVIIHINKSPKSKFAITKESPPLFEY